ncbi:MAG TPA: hypothetical protein VKY71_09370 [Actinotalea caeni]|uniref:hypothetical protein n=1 Tax=Actinotalea caeni TaxID=1348467 RepID=UPI002B4B6527|nr:hypothetical protein [Actinotalea caeni]HLV55766.1 hypothetical protein [Actinotalea caeni]
MPVSEGRARLAAGCALPLPRSADHARVTVGIRAEGFEVVGAAADGDDVLEVTVARVERMGSEILAFCDPVAPSESITIDAPHLVVRLDKRQQLAVGDALRLRLHLPEVLVFDPDGVTIG